MAIESTMKLLCIPKCSRVRSEANWVIERDDDPKHIRKSLTELLFIKLVCVSSADSWC